MKKTYFAPALMDLEMIEEQDMLVVSGFEENLDNTGIDDSQMLGREDDLWED
jgi:hypothetical protein